MNKMKPFTKYDWYDLAGAERFSDGSEPLVGRYDSLTVCVDRNGLQAWLEEIENNVFTIQTDEAFKDITIHLANLLLQRAEQMTKEQLVAVFSKL